MSTRNISFKSSHNDEVTSYSFVPYCHFSTSVCFFFLSKCFEEWIFDIFSRTCQSPTKILVIDICLYY